jgi:hypothetical protein
MIIALLPLSAEPALAEPPAIATSASTQRADARELGANLRLLAQPTVDQSSPDPLSAAPSHSSFGIGMIRAGPKAPDDRLYGRVSQHSAAVKFRLKF